MTQAPATPELVERLKEYASDWRNRAGSVTAVEEAIAALEAQQARIAELEADRDNWRSRAAERDEECERRFQAQHAAQALADRYEKALTWIALFAETRVRDSDRTFAKVARGAVQTIAEHSRQALSSQGRREGGEDGLPELPCGVGPSDLTDPQSQHSDGEG